MNDLIVETSGKIVSIILNNPPVNALTLSLYQRLATTFEQVAQAGEANCIVLTARGSKAFCAGLDLQEFLASKVEDDPARAAVIRGTFEAIRLCPIPVIAAVNGPALGAGMVLAAASDIRIASDKATFGMPEINVGRCGGAAHVGRLISPGMLRLMYFTGEPIGAQEALRVGLVQEVVIARRLLPVAYDLAGIIAKKSPIGLRMAKDALNQVEFMQTEAGYELEQSYSTRLMATQDAREAIRAVVEKREPTFVGR